MLSTLFKFLFVKIFGGNPASSFSQSSHKHFSTLCWGIIEFKAWLNVKQQGVWIPSPHPVSVSCSGARPCCWPALLAPVQLPIGSKSNHFYLVLRLSGSKSPEAAMFIQQSQLNYYKRGQSHYCALQQQTTEAFLNYSRTWLSLDDWTSKCFYPRSRRLQL